MVKNAARTSRNSTNRTKPKTSTTARLASSSIRLRLLTRLRADRAFARRTPCGPAEEFTVVPEATCLVPDDVATRIEEREGTLGDGLAVAFEAGIGFGERILRLVALVPFDVVDQGNGGEAGMERRNNLPQPLRERIGPDAVVDLCEVFKGVPFEDVRVFKMELLSLILQLNDGFNRSQCLSSCQSISIPASCQHLYHH